MGIWTAVALAEASFFFFQGLNYSGLAFLGLASLIIFDGYRQLAKIVRAELLKKLLLASHAKKWVLPAVTGVALFLAPSIAKASTGLLMAANVWPSLAAAGALGLGTISALGAVLWQSQQKETFAYNAETQDERELREFLQARGHQITRLPGNAVDWILNGVLTEVKSLQPTTKTRGLKRAIRKASKQMKRFLAKTLPNHPDIVPSEIEAGLNSDPNAPKIILVDVRRTQLSPKKIMDVIISWFPENKQNLNVLVLLPNQGQSGQGALYYEGRSNKFVVSELDRVMEPGKIPSFPLSAAALAGMKSFGAIGMSTAMDLGGLAGGKQMPSKDLPPISPPLTQVE